jgi:hypothetical protein
MICSELLLPGNIAIGNLHQFLPSIVKMIESEPKKRLLALHASKEVRQTQLRIFDSHSH